MEEEDPNFVSPLKDRPELEEWENEYVMAFYRLTSSRQTGMSIGAIPLSEILVYWEYFELDDLEEFVFIIQAVDNAYLEQMDKDSKNKSSKKAKK